MIWIIGHFLAICIGLSLGLIGGGGSILAVPILIYVMKIGAKEAITMSLFIVGSVSLIGAIPHWMQGNLNWRVAGTFAPAAMLGAYLGARIAAFDFITETFQLICFAVIMVLASVLMIRKGKPPVKNQDSEPENDSHQEGHSQWWAIPLEGLGVGILTGFVGVGGGFAIIPALVLLGGIPMKEAIGTSLIIIAFKSMTGFAGYLDQVELDWALMISFTIAASFGTIAGAYLTRLIDAKSLQKGFGYFVLAVGIFVLIQR
ncbi:sulfite exporter TauE/SafE family protein [Okeania sp.]|uniref:sulfite exporter TauE/SafE family protein n=1 Tax=Okeania sp. TaxID=3100323 RepID=UPI002B4ACB61|nr:sulfite exporter TauE/SafE family protein [Okeania sp.]MEB3340198.1 sulfite exporter TauE/SafE family protein [Okeania sp.]